MTDITERLREAAQGEELFGFDGMRGDPDPLLTEAADEIDRLRARVAELESLDRGGWVRTLEIFEE